MPAAGLHRNRAGAQSLLGPDKRHAAAFVAHHRFIPARVVVDLFPSIAPALPRQLGETGHRQCGAVSIMKATDWYWSKGIVTRSRDGREGAQLASWDAADLVRPPPLPARGHPARRPVVPPLHAEPPRRRRP